jgi:FHA domain
MSLVLKIAHQESCPRMVPLAEGQALSVGRSPTNSVRLPEIWVSRTHCVFLLDGEGVWVDDRSRQGIFQGLERIRVQRSRPRKGDYFHVRPGEVLSMGDYAVHVDPCEPVNPSWLAWKESTVVRIARAIRDEKSYDDLPILGDALEDAGCDNEGVLHHCRKPGRHVHACWVLDWILGKEVSERAANTGACGRPLDRPAARAPVDARRSGSGYSGRG